MKHILNFYIIREIIAPFLLGITLFTLILLMGRLIKLTDLVISRGVPLADIAKMILCLMPSFFVFTIPMAFLLAVLLAFGRLSADNEVTVMKASGISLAQLMPPVLICGFLAVALTLLASTIGIPWGNSAFKRISLDLLKQNVTATIREKVFWDEIPGVTLYTEHYDEQKHLLKGVLIHDGRDKSRPMTIFAKEGQLDSTSGQLGVALSLVNGSIHVAGKSDQYRLIHFNEYLMSMSLPEKGGGINRNELDMGIDELSKKIADIATPKQTRLKMEAELHSRFAFPFASLVFAIVAVPLGIQNRRAGKSSGFSISIGILLTYYILLSLMRTLAEKGTLPAVLALWLPNIIFMAAGCYLLWMASMERTVKEKIENLLVNLSRRKSK